MRVLLNTILVALLCLGCRAEQKRTALSDVAVPKMAAASAEETKCIECKGPGLPNEVVCKRVKYIWQVIVEPEENVALYDGSHKLIKKIRSKDLQSSIFNAIGCAESGRSNLSNGTGCKRLREYWTTAFGPEVKKITFYSDHRNAPFSEYNKEMSVEYFKYIISYKAGCCSSWPFPLGEDWMQYMQLDCIWETLQKEIPQKIAFCSYPVPSAKSLDEWQCDEIIGSEKVNEVMRLLGKAIADSNDRFVNEKEIDTLCCYHFMQIATDKHKILLPIIFTYDGGRTIHGIGWSSYELGQKLDKWWHQSKDANQPK